MGSPRTERLFDEVAWLLEDVSDGEVGSGGESED
eukprot:COSAG06_NODE_3173_length_5735_cov_131.450142_7_plen_34_part_00